MLNAITLNVVISNVDVSNVVMLNVAMPNVIMSNVTMLIVVSPMHQHFTHHFLSMMLNKLECLALFPFYQ
jgi:hypothetical protein